MDLNQIAPCGIDCVTYEMFAANGNRDAWERAAARRDGKAEDFVCKGCREQGAACFFRAAKTAPASPRNGVISTPTAQTFPAGICSLPC